MPSADNGLHELRDIVSAEIAATASTQRPNLITGFYESLRAVARSMDADNPPPPAPPPGTFVPSYRLPDPGPAVADYFSCAEAAWRPFGSYADQALTLLDLTRDPGTNTTKTYPSLLIVARAVEHIRLHGEPVILFTPTSANKGVALRHAVQRALACGLARPQELRVVVLAPKAAAGKLRADRLSRDAGLAALNPVLVYDSPVAEDVKALGRAFVAEHAESVWRGTGARLWFTLDLANYVLADVSRALFEHAVCPVDEADRPRTHVHAVSSAFGMLGYHRGRRLLEDAGISSADRRPHTLLVQHLNTPHMVLDVLFGAFDRSAMPAYRRDPADGRYHQHEDRHFPAVTADPQEVLDPTFYTREPATAKTMSGIIAEHGGDGIVVSALECLERYPLLRGHLEDAGLPVPQDPGRVREWSLAMALTGVMNAIDRGLVKQDHDLVVHGSGWYTAESYTPLGAQARDVATAADIARIVRGG